MCVWILLGFCVISMDTIAHGKTPLLMQTDTKEMSGYIYMPRFNTAFLFGYTPTVLNALLQLLERLL